MPARTDLVEISPQWSLWRTIMVRGAGFPVARILRLAAPEAEAAAVLRETAGDPLFREAVLWQNRGALATALDRVRDGRDDKPSRRRKHEQLVARYLQRYCTKNERIGFFGPTGWGRLSDDAATIVRPGPQLVAERRVHFEHWAIDTLAAALARDASLRAELAPRLSPFVRLDGTTLHEGPRAFPVPAVLARLLSACDGKRSARQIVSDLREDDGFYDLLEEYAGLAYIAWTLEVPVGVRDPDRALRAQLERVARNEPRERALATLARLESARDDVARARDPRELDRALGWLETVFTYSTGKAPTRSAGEMYAARTLVYLDCRRDLELSLGRPVLDRLAPALQTVLASARWYTHEIARRYRTLFGEAHRELGGGAVAYVRFWEHVAPHIPSHQLQRSAIVEDVANALTNHCAPLWRGYSTKRQVEHDARSVRLHVERKLQAPGPGWPTARHLSPDILIAARDVAALERGKLVLVLGELHIGNTLTGAFDLHPQPDSLLRAFELDREIVCVAPVESKAVATRSGRVSPLPRDLHVELGPSRSWRDPEHVLRVADLVVEERDGALEVVDRARGHRFDIIAFFDQYLTFVSSSHFALVPPLGHVPRISIAGVVIVRERWELPASDFEFCRARSPSDRFAGARAMAQRHGFPRWVFAKVPEERKPLYVDLESPILVELLAAQLRKSTSATITEMLPDPDHVWLPDAEGQTYTCELRMVAVDARSWSPR